MTRYFAGVDVGTSFVKAAVYDDRGVAVRQVRRPMPALQVSGAAVWQPLEPCFHALEQALKDLELETGGVEWLALTTQRDTALLLDDDGQPLTPLISWRDVRERELGSVWDALAGDDGRRLSRAAHVRSLTSWLTERLAGRAAETSSTRSRHLDAAVLRRLDHLVGRTVSRPDELELGEDAGRTGAGLPVRLSAGDKNCELLGNGILGPERAALSLGTAISLGVLLAGSPPPPTAGLVATRGAVAGRWNLETGLPVGLQAERVWERLLVGEPKLTAELLGDLWCLPHFAGALDCPGLAGAIIGLHEAVPATAIYQAWAQGVAGELRRLLPKLEGATGVPIERVILNGGGAAAQAWSQLLADALRRPIVRRDDPWRGARGAVTSALLARAPRDAEPFLVEARTWPDAAVALPRGDARRIDAYYATYGELTTGLGRIFGGEV